MKKVRLGIIGIGTMGSAHAKIVLSGHVPHLELTALADAYRSRLEAFPEVKHFGSAKDIIASREIDALLIATPHYDHTTVGIAALKAGLHVLVEKPISVHKGDCEKLIAAYRGREKKQVFGAMFNQRTDPFFQKIRGLVQGGELGEIRRVNWIITNWYRPEVYYASGGWRATWAGEGGGVLLNQCPHQLDLFQWMFGMPVRVRAFCGFGRYHDIEVEDDVTAYTEFANGATGVFITSTGEAPGTNRLEIAGDRGRLVYENDTIAFTRNETPMHEFSRTATGIFSKPDAWDVSIPVSGHGGQHTAILEDFTNAIVEGSPLLAPAVEGIHSVELANAMLLSAWTNRTVDIPLDAAAYARQLKQKIKTSKPRKKKRVVAAVADLSKSFNS